MGTESGLRQPSPQRLLANSGGIPRPPAVVPLDLEVVGGSRLDRAICAPKAIKENLEWATPADRPKKSASEAFEGLTGPGQLDHCLEWHSEPHFKFGGSCQERTGFPRALAGDQIAKLASSSRSAGTFEFLLDFPVLGSSLEKHKQERDAASAGKELNEFDNALCGCFVLITPSEEPQRD